MARLILNNIYKSSDVECYGRNNVGTNKKTLSINVIDPWVTPGYQELDSGSSLTIKCLTGGERKWYGPKYELLSKY